MGVSSTRFLVRALFLVMSSIGHSLVHTPRIGEVLSFSFFFFFLNKGTNPIMRAPRWGPLNYLSKPPLPSTITLEIKVSSNEFWGQKHQHSVQCNQRVSIPQRWGGLHSPPSFWSLIITQSWSKAGAQNIHWNSPGIQSRVAKSGVDLLEQMRLL